VNLTLTKGEEWTGVITERQNLVTLAEQGKKNCLPQQPPQNWESGRGVASSVRRDKKKAPRRLVYPVKKGRGKVKKKHYHNLKLLVLQRKKAKERENNSLFIFGGQK